MSPYEQKTQQSPAFGVSTAPHAAQSYRQRQKSVGIVSEVRLPQLGQVNSHCRRIGAPAWYAEPGRSVSICSGGTTTDGSRRVTLRAVRLTVSWRQLAIGKRADARTIDDVIALRCGCGRLTLGCDEHWLCGVCAHCGRRYEAERLRDQRLSG